MPKNKNRQKSTNKESEKSASSATPARKSNAPLDMVLLVLAAAGILLTAYLAYGAWFDVHPAFCSEGSGCDVVQGSRWATLLEIPMAFWGCLTYIIIAWFIWKGRTKSGSGTPLLFVAIGGFAVSAYLTIISLVEIEATCPYCLASFAIITTIMILSIVRRPPNWSTSVKEAAVIALLIVGGLHMHYSGLFSAAAGPEDPQLQALAIHLADTGVARNRKPSLRLQPNVFLMWSVAQVDVEVRSPQPARLKTFVATPPGLLMKNASLVCRLLATLPTLQGFLGKNSVKIARSSDET